MALATDAESILRQNLLDAGCDPETIQRCVLLIQLGETAKLAAILANHRQVLLDAVHQNEERIDCLDYLLYQLKKQSIGGISHERKPDLDPGMG